MRLILGIAMLALTTAFLPPSVWEAEASGGALQDKKEADAKTESVQGTLQSVDNNQLKIARSAGQPPVTVKLDSQTKITLDGKEAALTDLKVGLKVSCTFSSREGMNLCLSLTASSKK
jgi:hypothetical protein